MNNSRANAAQKSKTLPGMPTAFEVMRAITTLHCATFRNGQPAWELLGPGYDRPGAVASLERAIGWLRALSPSDLADAETTPLITDV